MHLYCIFTLSGAGRPPVAIDALASHPLSVPCTVPITAPTLSAPLRQQLATLADDPAVLVERSYAALRDLEGYRMLAPAIRDDIFQSITRTTDLCFRSLLTGTPPADDVMIDVENSARRRVHQHVPLESILRAFQIGAREVWRATTEMAHANRTLADQLLFDVWPYLFDYFDEMTRVITKAYTTEQYEQARWRDSILHQLYTVVFHAPEDHDTFTAAVQALGLDATLPRLALAIDAALEVLPPDIRNAETERLALGVARHFRVTADQIVHMWHRGRMIVWVPCARGVTIAQHDRAAHDSARHLTAGEPGIRMLGIGLTNHGADGWAASAAEAVRAMELVPCGPVPRKVHGYSSIALEESVRGTANVLHYLVSLIEQLGDETGLLDTLKTYFTEGQRRRPTADVLGIHPNTLNYRLERIENILGASLNDAGWIAKLNIALALRQHLPPTP